MLAGECVHPLVIRRDEIPFAGRDGGVVVAHGDELLVERVDGVGIVEFLGGVNLHMVRVHVDPWFRRGVRRGEAGIFGRVPLHRSACVVAADQRERGHHRFG